MHTVLLVYRAAKRIGEGRANTKSGDAQNGLCEGTPLENFEILDALKCVLEAPEALFHACTQYIYTYKLLLSKR